MYSMDVNTIYILHTTLQKLYVQVNIFSLCFYGQLPTASG